MQSFFDEKIYGRLLPYLSLLKKSGEGKEHTIYMSQALSRPECLSVYDVMIVTDPSWTGTLYLQQGIIQIYIYIYHP